MKIRLINTNDSDDLLTFEIKNRRWFEGFIVGRDQLFYCDSSIAAHIHECLIEHARGRMWPSLIKGVGGEIIGRANLRNIDQKRGSAEIGYRVAQSAAGQGVATFAVTQLQHIAFQQLGLKQIKAMVLDNNPASEKVLQKSGFEKTAEFLRFAQVNNRWFDAFEYRLFA